MALLALLVVASVAACGSAAGTAGKVGRVTYEVSGGFTGWDRILTVEADGTASVRVVLGPSPAAGSYHVDQETMDRLHALLSDPAFAQLEAEYPPPAGGADLQSYTVTVGRGGRTIKTTTHDAASPPQILHDVLAILNGIMAANIAR
jgi:hypothetical protein